MKSLLRENLGEALVGVLVVIFAALFVSYAWQTTGGGRKAGALKVVAMFPSAAGIAVGTDVKVSGIKVGSVSAQKLDPASFQVAVTLSLDPSVKLPNDSTAAVSSEGLLGANFVALTPGGSETPFKTGDTITDTQGSMDMMALIGQFINKSGSSTPAPAAGAPAK